MTLEHKQLKELTIRAETLSLVTKQLLSLQSDILEEIHRIIEKISTD